MVFQLKRNQMARYFGLCFNSEDGGAGGGSDAGAGDGAGGGSDAGAGAGAGTRTDLINAGAGGSDAGAGAGAGSDSDNAFVPKEHVEGRAYLKDVKDWGSLFKQIDGFVELAGKKAVPANDAPAEEWESFFSRTRPAEGYGINKEHIFEKLRDNETFSNGLSEVFHKAGLTQKQVDILMDPETGYTGLVNNTINGLAGDAQATKAKAEEMDNSFEGKAEQYFGDRKGVAIDNAVSLLTEATKELKLDDGLDKLISENPDALVGLVARLDFIHRTHLSQDALERGGGGGNEHSNDPVKLQQALNTYKSKNWAAYTNPAHAEHEGVVAQAQAITDQIMKLSK